MRILSDSCQQLLQVIEYEKNTIHNLKYVIQCHFRISLSHWLLCTFNRYQCCLLGAVKRNLIMKRNIMFLVSNTVLISFVTYLMDGFKLLWPIYLCDRTTTSCCPTALLFYSYSKINQPLGDDSLGYSATEAMYVYPYTLHHYRDEMLSQSSDKWLDSWTSNTRKKLLPAAIQVCVISKVWLYCQTYIW